MIDLPGSTIVAVGLGVAAYLLGSINASILLFRLLGLGDPRDRHSGNPGVTNVYRQAGLGWALVVLLFEAAKAAAVGVVALRLDAHQIAWLGLALVLGNCFPIFHGFRGGKGVANFLGFSLFTAPVTALASCVAWVLVFAIVRVPFLASMAMLACLSLLPLWQSHTSISASIATILTTALIVLSHRQNFQRWLRTSTDKVNHDTSHKSLQP